MNMDTDLLQVIRSEIREAVKTTVNGKIERLQQTNDSGMAEIRRQIAEHNASHEKDMQEIKPMMQFVAGGKVLGDVIKWLGAVAMAYIALKGFFMK